MRTFETDNYNDKYPLYNPDLWNNDPAVRWSHNCYAYAADHIDANVGSLCRKKMTKSIIKVNPCKQLFPQPGRAAGITKKTLGGKWNCNSAEKGILADNPKIFKINADSDEPSSVNYRCPAGMYKIAMATKPDGSDYHFWREDSSGESKTWSHKAGARRATNRDYSLRIIKNPETSNRGDYNNFCGFYCVPIGEKNISY